MFKINLKHKLTYYPGNDCGAGNRTTDMRKPNKINTLLIH